MQDIHTQAEYDELRAKQRASQNDSTDELQKLCTAAAKHIPVRLAWAPKKGPAPWGRIL